jgi:nucleoside 2-deoxyribosyltransferase
MQHKKIYLAGPIAGTSYNVSALGWRAYVDEQLTGFYPNKGVPPQPDAGIQLDCYSPMRGKGFLRDLKKDEVLGKLPFNQSPVSTTNGILGRDRNDCMKSDLIFMNMLGAKETSIGTTVELGWADAARVPVVLVMEDPGTVEDSPTKSNVHEHLFFQGLITYRLNNLDDAIACAKLILLPGI